MVGPESKPRVEGLGKGASKGNEDGTQNDPELAEGEGHPGGEAWGPSVLDSPTEGEGWLRTLCSLVPAIPLAPKDQSGPVLPRNGRPAHSGRASTGVFGNQSALLSVLPF